MHAGLLRAAGGGLMKDRNTKAKPTKSLTRLCVLSLAAYGLKPSLIAHTLGLSEKEMAPHWQAFDLPASPVIKTTGERIVELASDGLNQAQIARVLNVSNNTISWHWKRMGLPTMPRGRPRKAETP